MMLCACSMGGCHHVLPSIVIAAPSSRLSMPCPAKREDSRRKGIPKSEISRPTYQKCAMMFAQNHTFSPSLANTFQEHLPIPKMEQGSTSRRMDFGEAALNEPTSMSGFLTHTLPRIDIPITQHAIASMRRQRRGHMSKES